MYSVQESIDMIYILGECHKNSLLASRVYAERFAGRQHPDARSFNRLKQKFESTGSVCDEKKTRSKRVASEENQILVAASVVEQPHTSTRKISRTLDVSKTTVNKILRGLSYHPYHIQLHQQLNNNDFEKRLEFCLWANTKVATELDFFNIVLFSDEATFHNYGSVNRHNFHYYSTNNPLFIRPIDRQNQWSLNVWGGIVDRCVIGPYFFDSPLNGNLYLNFIQNNLPVLLEDVSLNVRARLWYQHDGAPAHYSENVRRYLTNEFGNRWIGRGGPASWPPRSPDLTCMDFFL
jgi:SOS response regulatory protein OraA/RecX